MSQPFFVSAIEGNIGVGKSTLLPKLASELTKQTGQQWEPVLESVDTDPEFQRLLALFTQDQERYRVEFQNYITDLNVKLANSLQAGKHYLLERSLLGCLIFSFADESAKEQDEHIVRIRNAFKDYIDLDCVLYLQADYRVCYQRMVGRGREAEQGTPESYIQHIANMHDKHMPQLAKQYGYNLLTVDYTHFTHIPTLAKDMLMAMNWVNAPMLRKTA